MNSIHKVNIVKQRRYKLGVYILLIYTINISKKKGVLKLKKSHIAYFCLAMVLVVISACTTSTETESSTFKIITTNGFIHTILDTNPDAAVTVNHSAVPETDFTTSYNYTFKAIRTAGSGAIKVNKDGESSYEEGDNISSGPHEVKGASGGLFKISGNTAGDSYDIGISVTNADNTTERSQTTFNITIK